MYYNFLVLDREQVFQIKSIGSTANLIQAQKYA